MNKQQNGLMISFAMLIMLLFAGCATVNKQHPLIVTDEDIKAGNKDEYADVYFIRPRLLKTKGPADKTIRVEFQGQTLLNIGEGSYTLLRIKPSKGQVKVYNETKFINKIDPIEVWRAREYKFIPDKTYFIYLRRIDEEFRGVFFEPEPVTLKEAKILIDQARASGNARHAPIDKLTEVSEPPSSATDELTPALPENIYKSEKYLKPVR